MNITLYQFSKRENSTLCPSGSGTTVSGVLREPCDILNPVFKLTSIPTGSAPAFPTYAYIPAFSRYYFITNWESDHGIWNVYMAIDVLASYRTEIGNTSEYILRTDSTTDYNGEITDTMYPATTDIQYNTFAVRNIFTDDLTVGCYIVGIISGENASAVGAISYYAMTSQEFGSLKQLLFSNDNLKEMGIVDSSGQTMIPDMSQQLLKTLYNPYQYIVSCMWFPFPVSAITTSVSVHGISVGWWDYDSLTGRLLYAQTLELGNETFGFNHHPQYSRGTYLDKAPYTRRTAIGRFGTVPLDSAYFDYGNSLYISYVIDLITGQCITQFAVRDIQVPDPVEKLIAQRTFLIGVPIQLAQVGIDYLGAATQAISTIGSAIEGGMKGAASGGIGGAIAGALTSSASGIYNTLSAAMPQVETAGANGSFLAPVNQTMIVEQFYTIVDEDIAHRGRPLCENRTINTLSGFILCAEGDISISCLDQERKMISQYLTSGFFWE